MSSKTRNVALLLPAFVLATGLASAQPGVKVSTVNIDGTVTTNSFTATTGGPGAKSPTPAPDGSAKYWDGLGLGGASTNYFTQVPYIVQQPIPSIAAGPDDILTIVNRTIARWPNPNAAGNTGTLNPYNYPPTEFVPLDVWIGLTALGTQAGGAALCPSGTGSNSTCVIDNASIRYDQLQGRFVVVFTVTDMPAHRSNWVVVVSAFSQFQKCPVPAPAGSVCPTSSPLFTPPVIAPIVGGTATGGQNTANWTLYSVPINLLYNTFQQPNALGLIANPAAPAPFNNAFANSAAGTPVQVTVGGDTSSKTFLAAQFCANGGPLLPLTYGNGIPNGTAGGTGRTCTDYFPTNSRFGIDNDNIILTAPVLDMAYAPNEGRFPSLGSANQGRYAGTRVVSLAKIVLYNGTKLNTGQPGNGNSGCLADTPIDCNEVNLMDNTATGTLTNVNAKIAFGQGGAVGAVGQVPDLTNSTCQSTVPVATLPKSFSAPTATPAAAVLSCAPLSTLPNALPAIFWEPDNVRGRALASFDAQVAPFGSAVAGVVTPLDYLIGTEITDNFGGGTNLGAIDPFLSAAGCIAEPTAGCPGIVSQGVPGVTGQGNDTSGANAVTVSVTAFTTAAPFTATIATVPANLAVGMITPGGNVITAITGNVLSLTQKAFSNNAQPLPANLTFGTSAVPGSVVPLTAGLATKYYVQSIAFSCPALAIFSGPSGVTFCGQGVPGGQSLVPDFPFLGKLFSNVSTLAQVADPAPVGEGFSASQMTTSPANNPVSPSTNDRLFVGDSRPEQVIFREGLLYIARNARVADQQINWLGTSTVLYDIIKTCAVPSNGPSNCGNYSTTGSNLSNPALAFEYQWQNGILVPDPNGDINGFGFYEPMFESPADVSATGPISPISTLQLFDKLFVGMTTGGTSNTLATFSKDFPSLWDFRPGDDVYDTVEPYLDPYYGNILTTYTCGGDVTTSILAISGSTVTVNDTTGIGVGMFVTGQQIQVNSISGNVITLSAALPSSFKVGGTITFSRLQPPVTTTATLITAGSNQITVQSTTGLAIGQTLGSSTASATVYSCITAICPPNATTNANNIGISTLTNIGLSESIAGNKSGSISTNLVSGFSGFIVPAGTQIAIGEAISTNSGSTGSIAGNVTDVKVNADLTLTVTSSANASVGGPASITLDPSKCFTGNVVATTNSSPFIVKGVNVPGVTISGGPPPAGATNGVTCTSFYADGTVGNSTGSQPGATLAPILNGSVINNGLPATFTTPVGTGTATSIFDFPTGLQIINIQGNTLTLSGPANTPLVGSGFATVPGPGTFTFTTTTQVPLSFITAPSSTNVTCPIIPFSPHGGASTDPNDGSLWLVGEFAKNRLSTIPGPGQWGTSVANYALSFPAIDPYGNDNTYFQDVQPTGSPDSPFFTWIQLAKNLNLAVPSATGPCTINNGLPPILQPPVSGTLPTPSPSTLGCPYFGPDTVVTRAEMAYWVVKSFFDEQQITNYLCATGGDPSGLSAQCNGAIPASTFADLGTGGGSIVNPFLQPSASNAALGIAGVTNQQLMRYIEVMARRGITKGCINTIDPTSAYCPNQPVTRAQMSVFLIRAKMDNVFPTTLSGINLASPYGDNFGVFLPPTPYFSDVTAADPVVGPYYIYIQKMRELRITNGTGGATFSPNNSLTRKEIATFIVRAFFL